MSGHDVRGDQPRLVVVCGPDIYQDVHDAVMSLKLGDVLVKTSDHLPEPKDHVYILDGDFLKPIVTRHVPQQIERNRDIVRFDVWEDGMETPPGYVPRRTEEVLSRMLREVRERPVIITECN